MSASALNNLEGLQEEYDIIVAGGGTAGCVLAGRLAKADANLSILVIESGPDNKDQPTIVNPALFLANLAPDTKLATFYQSKASTHLNGREAIVPMGGCLGGGSSINFMMYTRAQAVDFESWETDGWRTADLLPLLKKTEHLHVDDKNINKALHGYEGDFNVSRGSFTDEDFQDDYIRAAGSLGMPEEADVQDLKQAHAVQRWFSWVDPATGKRQDVPHRLIHPLLAQGNTKLRVVTEHKVVRVLFDENKKANAVEFVASKGAQEITALTENLNLNGDGSPKVKTVKARKLVVVSCGTLSTPQVLQRSGVGSKALLEKLKIDVVADVASGELYEDHHLTLIPYKSKAPATHTIDGILSGRFSVPDAMAQMSENNNRGLLGWNSIDISSKLRPTPEEVKRMGPEFEELWNRDFKDHPTRPLMLMATVAAFLGDHSTIPAGQYFTMGSYTAYPYSRGYIHITGKSVNDPPDFDAGFFSHPADVTKQIWAYKKQREIVRRMKHFDGIMEGMQPKFREDSKAVWPKEVEDYTTVTNEIDYDEGDDAAIEDFVRDNVQTTWHSCGSCPMKARKDGGVVDAGLNVYGVTGLKLCDLSIIPQNVGANTYSTALLVGEKAAQIVAGELGIAGF